MRAFASPIPGLLLVVVALAATHLAHAGEPTGPATIVPAEKDRNRHDEFLTVAKAGGVDLLFLGDSITDGWRGGGKAVWDQFFAPLKAANFGISGDRTEHVIWRLRHGELEGIQPKLLVLMIGTNNGESANDVALGIKTIIADIQERSPPTRILLLGIFPRGAKPDGRQRNEQVNALISAYADGRRVVYQDIGASFLTADGALAADIMPDFLHPNEKGYRIWAEAIIDQVKLMLQDDPGHLVPAFSKRSTVLKVFKAEDVILAGKVGAGATMLEKLAGDGKHPPVAEAATASLEVVTGWRAGIDAQIALAETDGDIFLAAELAAGMAAAYSGDDAKAYQAEAAAMKKSPDYAAGKEFQRLKAMPFAARKDPRFAKLVQSFTEKHPDGFYARQATAMLPKQ